MYEARPRLSVYGTGFRPGQAGTFNKGALSREGKREHRTNLWMDHMEPNNKPLGRGFDFLLKKSNLWKDWTWNFLRARPIKNRLRLTLTVLFPDFLRFIIYLISSKTLNFHVATPHWSISNDCSTRVSQLSLLSSCSGSCSCSSSSSSSSSPLSLSPFSVYFTISSRRKPKRNHEKEQSEMINWELNGCCNRDQIAFSVTIGIYIFAILLVS